MFQLPSHLPDYVTHYRWIDSHWLLLGSLSPSGEIFQAFFEVFRGRFQSAEAYTCEAATAKPIMKARWSYE